MPQLRLPRRLRRFWREDKGSAAVEFVVMTPLLLLVAVGILYLLSLISLYNTLYSATYRAARYLSVEGQYIDWGTARLRVRDFIVDEVKTQQAPDDTTKARNAWLNGANSNWVVDVRLTSQRGDGVKPNGCAGTSMGQPFQVQDVEFTVEAGLRLDASNIPIVKQILSGAQPLTLVTRHTSFLECGQTELKR